MYDPHAKLRDEVLRQVLDGPGEVEPSVRRAAASGSGVPADLQSLVDKIHKHAYRVTDEDIARLQGTHSDDYLFEIVVSGALGASRKRLLAGMQALEAAGEADEA
jgi:hypothetical protein